MYGPALTHCKPDIKEDDCKITPRSGHGALSAIEKEEREQLKKIMIDKFPNEYKNSTSTYVFKEYEENEPVSYYNNFHHDKIK